MADALTRDVGVTLVPGSAVHGNISSGNML